MNRTIKKFAAGLFMLTFMALIGQWQTLTSLAATGKLSFSDPSASVGNQVSVTMKIVSTDGPGLGSSDVMLNYDSSALEFIEGTNANGGAGSIRVQGDMEAANQTTFSFTLKFKALKAGTSAITVASQEVYDADSQMVELSHVGNSSVKVEAPSDASSEAALSSLTISPGVLNPEFSENVTAYTTTVSGDVEKLTVSAPAKDDGATVVINGNENLQVGENIVECRVTAEDGSTVKTYTITVTKVEGNAGDVGESGEDIPVDAAPQDPGSMDMSNWQVAETFDAGMLPEGFSQSEYQYNGMTVQSGVDASGRILLYMNDENGNGDFFLYDEESGLLAPYVAVLTAEKTILVLPPSAIPEGTEIPDNFARCTIDIGNHTVDGWIWNNLGDEAPEYCVVYGMNENGERNFYRYDQKEMTLQRYFEDPDAAEIRDKYEKQVEDFNSLVDDYDIRGIFIAVLFGVCIVLIIAVIVLLLTRKPRGPKEGKRQRIEDFEEQEPVRSTRRSEPRETNSRASEPREYVSRTAAPKAAADRAGVSKAAAPQTSASKKANLREEDEFEEILDLDDEFEDEPAPRKSAPAESRREVRQPAARSMSAEVVEEEDDDFEFIDLDL